MMTSDSGGPPSPGGELQCWLDSQRERTNNARHALKRRLIWLQQMEPTQWAQETEVLAAIAPEQGVVRPAQPPQIPSVIVDPTPSEAAMSPGATPISKPRGGFAIPDLYLGAWFIGALAITLAGTRLPTMRWLVYLAFLLTALVALTWIGQLFSRLPSGRLPRWRRRPVGPSLAVGVLLVPLLNLLWAVMLVRWLTQRTSGDVRSTRWLGRGVMMALSLSVGFWAAVLWQAGSTQVWELNAPDSRHVMALAHGLISLMMLLGFFFLRQVETRLDSVSP